MNRIDIYLSEVGEHLPAKMRADLQAEIRSLIEDTLEDRSQAAGRAPDDAMVLEVLKEFGPPAQVAASYLPPRYLIGPRLFPTFLLVMRIVLIVLVVVALIRFGIAVSVPGLSVAAFLTILGEQTASFVGSALAALGNVVFIFAILEWTLPKAAEKMEDWDPRSLKPRAETDRVRPFFLILESVLIVGMILLLNVYSNWIGIFTLENGTWRMIPMLSEAFFRYVPLITVVWALHLGLNSILLRQGAWTRVTRWYQVGIKALEMIVLGIIIAGPAVVDPQFGQLGISPEAALTLERLAVQGFRALLVLLLLLSGWELVKMLLDLYAKDKNLLVIE